MNVLVSTQPFATGGAVFHLAHHGLTVRRWFNNVHQARDAGLRPCLVCRPEKRSEEG